ncbi:hypothetical protein BX616_007443 [Lobosporangium transversale]|uniref:Presenilin n=1 Tax=Lobosporangium transversale TaxID=64571 RepID=A0A1Y2G8P8_9FUNG|nr:Presenilin-domain-containing protein [Lobosporangium transversale]KAF9914847.1 hypothetical protein BX616_007443 [Lobosporangium transversale]ORZ04415.1 Presenilin-domain-containing protein [Lobosporangium transversale]|eukprot:XP_021876523.1 Presenilin-domain-containing protein [Lobosporangium transversale]
MSSLDTRGATAPSDQTVSSPSNGLTAESTVGDSLQSRNDPGTQLSSRTINQNQGTQREGNNTSNTENNDDQPCQSCGAFPAKFQCSACQSVRYCSQECQAEDWGIHYRECAEILAAMKQEEEQGRQRSDEERQDVEGGNSGSRDRIRSRLPPSGGNVLGEEAENVRAVANQPRRRPREPRRRPQLTPEQRAAYEEAERIADMKFYMLQIYKIIKPVVVCICLSILWVKISMAGSDYRPTQSSYTVYRESPTSTPSQNFLGSLANAGIIIGQIVVVTIIIVILFKRGHIKVLIGFFMIVVAMLLGFMGYILILNLIQVLRIPLDYLTMSFALWNFAVTGLLSVFWKGPMWLQQVYLTIMSSLMAFSLTGLAEWTTWMLLALLVVWDLIAVLCPFGPLKILVESSRNQNQEVPALLYTVNAVWFMASPPNSVLDREANRVKELNETMGASFERDSNTSSSTVYSGGHSRAAGREGGASISSSHTSGPDPMFNIGSSRISRTSSTIALVPNTAAAPGDSNNFEMRERTRSGGSSTSPLIGLNDSAGNGAGSVPRQPPSARQRGDERDVGSRNQAQDEHEEDGDDDDDGGLKLGLGDFVFYSVLIARAAMFDWVTTMCCTVAVLTGMNATIFLLAIYQKALPALPISICFGMLFYFATRFALVPFLAAIGPSQVFI